LGVDLCLQCLDAILVMATVRSSGRPRGMILVIRMFTLSEQACEPRGILECKLESGNRALYQLYNPIGLTLTSRIHGSKTEHCTIVCKR
jgi:hypothetical protein